MHVVGVSLKRPKLSKNKKELVYSISGVAKCVARRRVAILSIPGVASLS